jgi:hypothetical protein
MPRQEYYYNGELVNVSDDRSLADCLEERKLIWSYQCTEAIRSQVTDYEERNVANGIYDNEQDKKQSILNWIIACRNQYILCKNQSSTCITNTDIDAINYVAPVYPITTSVIPLSSTH